MKRKSDVGIIEPPLEQLAVQLNFTLEKPDLFVEAFTHSSYAHEHSVPSNERLEFLGDSVLGVIVCRYLFEHYPRYSEGELAKLKSTIVSAPMLAHFSERLHLVDYIRLGAGEQKSRGSLKVNIIADLFEAFIGAYYLSFGLEKTTELVLPLIEAELPRIMEKFEELNAKTHLQEWTQAKGWKPVYRTVSETGPPHNRHFTVEVTVNDRVYGKGTGRSIKEAQNCAARMALKELQHK
ncbi:MAG TPA: ribonuclease III [Bacillota bacterium]|nr:ribonuclease III [Bacillota bacterium]HPT88073.1 ribonuclease III [Bacillota bacterium]